MKKLLLSIMFSACAISTAHANPQYLQVLDPVYYMNMNPDIKRHAGGDVEKAKQHWLQYGVNEGRESAPWFSTKGYCQRQEPGFQAHFANCTNYRGLVDHFLNHGRAEGRATFPMGKDSHLLQIFDVQFYIDNYPDIKQHFSNNHAGAQNHWLQHGLNEARQGSYGFSLEAYMGHNADLLNVYGSNKNYSELALHFNHHGRKEGRSFTPALRTDLSGKLIAAHGDPRVFVIDNKGRKRHIASPQAAANCSLDLGRVQHIPKGELFIIASTAVVHGNNDCPQSGGTTAVSGNIDPIAEMLKAKPAAGVLLNSLRGMITLNNASGVNLAQNEVFAVEGEFNTKSVSGNHLVAMMLRSAGLASTRLFGLPETVKMKAALSFANNIWDLSLAIKLIDTFKTTPSLVPRVEPRLAFKDADLVLHAKHKIGTPMPTVSTELKGNFYFKPTVKDPWLALSPTADINNMGVMTVGGALKGVCGQAISANITKSQCKGAWDVFSMGVLQAQSGLLKLKYDPKKNAITAITTAIQNGLFNKTLAVDGALISDVSASPGFGLALTAKTSDPITFLQAMPFSGQAPFSDAFRAIPEGMSMSASAERSIIIAPTAMKVGHINYPRPTFAFRTAFSGAGVSASIDGALEGDMNYIVSGQSVQARQVSDIKLNMELNPGNIQAELKGALDTIPGMKTFSSKIAELFQLKKIYITAHKQIDGAYKTKGHIQAQILGPEFSHEFDVSVDNPFSPYPLVFPMDKRGIAGHLASAASRNFDVFGSHLFSALLNMDHQSALRLANELATAMTNGAPNFGAAFTQATNALKAAGIPIPQEVNDTVNSISNVAQDAGNTVKKAVCFGFC